MGKKYTTDSINIGDHSLDATMMVSLNTVVANHSNYLTTMPAHDQAWSTITSTPTTLAGYGITDAAPITVVNQTDFVSAANGGTFSGPVTISTQGVRPLEIINTSNASGAGVTFNDNNTGTQRAYITHFHSDSLSYGSGASIILGTTESTFTVLADGKLMYNEGIYSKPASGTGAGTRKDSNWDAAYTHSQAAHAPTDAEANVQADWNETTTTDDAFILNKPTTFPPSTHNHDDRYYTETETSDHTAQFLGWVDAYGTGLGVSWNVDEGAVEIQNSSDTSTGASYKARRVTTGQTIRVTLMAKASAAAGAGLYLRLYQHNGDLPDGKTHVSNNASASAVVVQEDDASVTNWVENAAITTDWVTYEKEYTVLADGYISIVVLNWTGIGTNSLYITTPDIQTVRASNSDKLDAQEGTHYLDYNNFSNVPTTFAPSAHNQAWSTITSTPTTLAGYGITDAAPITVVNQTDFVSAANGGTFSGDVTIDGDLDLASTYKITIGPNTTWSKSLIIGDNADNSTADAASIGTTNGNLHLDAATGGFATYLNYYDGTAGVAFGNGQSTNVAWMGPDGDLWKGSSDNTGSKYWHAGNDGTGSGLDADKLDGQQGTYYLDYNNFTNKPTIPTDFVSAANGGTFSGALTVSGSATRGSYTGASNYHTGADNIVLKGNSYGISGIFFESEKDGTNINHSSDFGFIQYHAYGTSTSGEENELIIGVSNDSTDHLIFNAPNAEGLRFRVGNSETDYKLYHEGHKPTLAEIGAQPSGTYNTVIGTDTDINTSGSTIVDNIYVTDGVITSMGTRILTPADIGAAPASHGHNYLPLTGGTLSGNLDVNADIQGNTFTQAASGIPRNNLGAPTVSEMALFDNQFTPKTTLANSYDDLTDLTFWVQTTSSSPWTKINTYSDDQKRRFLRTNNSSVVIPNGAYKFRVEFVGKHYTFANAMYAYWSSQSHNTQVHIWKYNQSTSAWTQHTNSSATVSSWPGHLYLPFSTIPWHESNTTSTGHFKSIRIEFTPTWSTGTYSDRDIILSGMQIWGGYPSGRRTIHSYDQNGKLNLYDDLNVPGDITVAGTVDGVDISALPTSFAPITAEQNVQSDWNATSGDAFILNKPDLSTFKKINSEFVLDVNDDYSARTGTWTVSNSEDDWGDPNIPGGRAYNDGTGTITFDIPADMQSCWISQLTWSIGGYVDTYGVQADGDEIFLRRINTYQNVENSNHGNNGQHDGSAINLAGTSLGDFSKIRIKNKQGRFHFTGISFSSSNYEGDMGTGVIHPAQIMKQGSGGGLDSDKLDGQHGSYYYAASNPSGYTTNTGDITSVIAGTGLTGGATSGAATLNAIGGDGITANADDIAVDNTVARRYVGTATGINNSAYKTAFTVNGGNLSSHIRFSVQGTTGSVVVSNLIDLSVNHSQDIQIKALSGNYTRLSVKVISNDNEDFEVQLKTNSANSVTLNIEVFPMGSEEVTFTDTSIHTGKTGTFADIPYGNYMDGVGGDEGDLFIGGDLTVGDGDIVLNGTGRIQGVDTVTSATDAASKGYVDNAIGGVPQGDITGVTAGTGMTGGGTSGDVTLNVIGGTGITANAGDIAIDATVVTLTGSQALTNKTGSNSQWTNDEGYTTNTGDITSVAAGTGLTGGGTSGAVTLSVTANTYTPYNDVRSLGVPAFTGGANPNITTAQVMSEIEADGGFDSYSSVFKTSWSYAGNYDLTDAGGFTETAGSSWITWTDNASDTTRGNITALAIAPNTGGSAGGVFIYNDQGGSYSPGWREVWTSMTDGVGSGLDADLLDAQHGTYYLDYNNFTNTPTIPQGDITAVTAGTNLNGGGTSGAVTLNLNADVSLTSLTLGQGFTMQESTDRADLLQITSVTSGYAGLQIRNSSDEGRWSFMTDGATAGFYDDENSDWAVQMSENNAVKLYHNGAQKLTTTSEGVDVTGAAYANNFRTHISSTNWTGFSRNSAGNATLYVNAATSNTNQIIAQFNYGSASANAGAQVLRVAKDKSYFVNTNLGVGVSDPTSRLTVGGGNVDITDNHILVDNQKGFINSGAWTRNATAHGYIDFGPANTSWAHIYTDRPNFYFNKEIYVLGRQLFNSGSSSIGNLTAGTSGQQMEKGDASVTTLRFDSDRWRLYAGASAGEVVSVKQTGQVGIGTDDPGSKLDIKVSSGTQWMNLINGSESAFRLTTYNNGTGNGTSAYAFKHGLYYNTTENAAITFYRGSGSTGGFLTFTTNNGSEKMRINGSGYVGIGDTNPSQKLTLNSGRMLIKNNATPFYIKVNSGYKSWVHHISSDDGYIFAPSTVDGGETWDWAKGTKIAADGTVVSGNFILNSDERIKTKIKDLACDNINVNWKSFEVKGNEGEYRTGVVAQELEKSHPEFVNTDKEGFKSVKYIDLLIAKIAELEARLEKLEK